MLPETTPAVEAAGVRRTYPAPGGAVLALDDISLTVARGEVVALVGPSGSGKSSLLYLLGGLDTADAGSVRVAGVDWRTLHATEQARFRRRTCGFIVQGLALLPQATAAENVEVPLLLDGVSAQERGERVDEALRQVGLKAEATKLIDQLSGGQQQRVSIARAIVHDPAVVLADEPTGSLDSANAQAITRILISAARHRGAAVVLVTHDPAVARHADRIVALRSGRLDPETRRDEIRQVAVGAAR